ncbi:hypothetical protein HMI56_002752 [Coelomomyces lativittatus]|nr:hypothetical protein HMI56_002752 [Coelomomyces lativittatus]
MNEIQEAPNISDNCVEIKVLRKAVPQGLFAISKSEEYSIGCIKFHFDFQYITTKVFLKLIVSKCQEGERYFEGVLIDFSLGFFGFSNKVVQGKSLFKRLFLPDASVDLGEFEFLLRNYFTFVLKFNFIYPFNFNSCLVFSFTPPSKTPFFRYLNNKEASDCCFQLITTKQELWVRKDIITFECSFFEKMLLGGWSRKLEDKINAPWSDKVFLGCILHLYTGWLPGTPICEEVFEKLNINSSTLNLDATDLSELYEVAKMLELRALSYFTLSHVIEIAEKEQASFIKPMLNISLN